MRPGQPPWHRWSRGPVWLALLTLSGCARFRAPPPPPEFAVPVEPPGSGAAGESASRTNNGRGRLVLDPSVVLSLQMQALDGQRQRYPDDPPLKGNSFTRWLDRTHENLFIRMDNAVRRLDTMWLPAGSEYDYKVSTFRIRVFSRMGGRGKEKDFDFKVRFSTKLALPGLERELYLFVDNIGRDDLPGADPLEQESDTRVGLRSERRFIQNGRLSTSGGVRLRSTGPVFYLDTEWRGKWNLGGGELVATPGLFYYSDDGFGQMASLVYTRPLGPVRAIQVRAVERSTETTDGLELEQTLRFAWYRSGRKRGWVVEGSLFPHCKNSTMYWDNARVNVTWRDSLYKKWIFYTLTPQVDFAREDNYDPQPSLRIGLEILLGGKPSDLM